MLVGIMDSCERSCSDSSHDSSMYDTTMTELTEQACMLTERHNQLNKLYEYIASVVYPVSDDVFIELVNSVCIDVCFDIHHEVKVSIFHEHSIMSSYSIAMVKGCASNSYSWIDDKMLTLSSSSEGELDIFGQRITSSCVAENVSCPHCDRSVHASRFSQHLEKCMGLGRNSGRSSSRRITCSAPIMSSLRQCNNSNSSSDILSLSRSVASVSSAGYLSNTDGDFVDNNGTGGGSEYNSVPARKRSHKKGGGCRKSSKQRKNDNHTNDSAASSGNDSMSTVPTVPVPAMLSGIFEDNMAMRRWAFVTSTSTSSDDNAALDLAKMQQTYNNPLLERVISYFQQHCGVVSALTSRMCAKTRNCHQHSEEQRQLIRARCFSEAAKQLNGESEGVNPIASAVTSLQSRMNEINNDFVDVDGVDDVSYPGVLLRSTPCTRTQNVNG